MKTLIAAALAAASLTISSTQSTAQNIGIQYDKMPVGTSAHYAQTNGDRWVDVYKGVKRGKHVVERFKGQTANSGRPLQTRYYDKQGRLDFYRAYGSRSKPYKIDYKPHSCYYVVGNCTHTERFSGTGYVNSGVGEKWIMNTQKTSSGYSTRWYKKREPNGGNTFTSKLGKYNLRTIEAWGSKGQYNIKLIKLVEGR